MKRYLPICTSLCLGTLPLAMSSCTVSFQNISTNGRAEDIVDDNLSAKAEPTISIPVSAVPEIPLKV